MRKRKIGAVRGVPAPISIPAWDYAPAAKAKSGR